MTTDKIMIMKKGKSLRITKFFGIFVLSLALDYFSYDYFLDQSLFVATKN